MRCCARSGSEEFEMTINGWAQILLFFALILVVTKPLGSYMATIFEGRRNFATRVLGPLERGIYRVCGIDTNVDQRWTSYAASLLAFSVAGAVLLYVIQRLQQWLPFNPQHFSAGNVSPDLAFNTSVS